MHTHRDVYVHSLYWPQSPFGSGVTGLNPRGAFLSPLSFLTSVDSGLGSLASGFPGQAEVVCENGTIMS